MPDYFVFIFLHKLTQVEKKKLKNVDSNWLGLDQIITYSSERPLQSKADIYNQDNSSFIVISSVKVRKRRTFLEQF